MATPTTTTRDNGGALGVRLVATLAFAVSPFLTSTRHIPLRTPVTVAVGLVSIAVIVCATLGSNFPPAVPLDGGITEVADLTAHPVLVASNLIGLVAFLVAAYGFTARNDDPFFSALAGAAVLGAFSRLHLALVPSLYTGVVYSGDIFRLAFHTAVLLAALGELSRYWHDRQDLAVADERRRVARELHDGMAQELAFISSTASRMAAADGHDEDVALIASAARRALDESRRAIATLTRPLDEPLPSALAETLSELARRTGGTVEMDLDPAATVSPAQREELLRIGREAVGNALRHAGCDTVIVTLTGGDRVTMTIADDGCGFDVDGHGNPYGFGLTSMAERAAALGAEFEITSTPQEGTTIVVTL